VFIYRVVEGMPPVIICVACNSDIQGKDYNSNLPVTAELSCGRNLPGSRSYHSRREVDPLVRHSRVILWNLSLAQ